MITCICSDNTRITQYYSDKTLSIWSRDSVTLLVLVSPLCKLYCSGRARTHTHSSKREKQVLLNLRETMKNLDQVFRGRAANVRAHGRVGR